MKKSRPLDKALSLNCPGVCEILVDFLREETQRVGFQKLVVGLSGGLDSALSLALAAKALGRSKVMAVLMPYKTSHDSSLGDGRAWAGKLGVRERTIPITPMVDAYFDERPKASRLRRGNKMARERMSILYDLSLEWGALVVGTSNKTELLLGYGTQHGDLASALNPLGDLYKTQVRELSRYLKLPKSIINKAPSADLFPGQTDEADLGRSYELLDQILFRLVDLRMGPDELRGQGYSKGDIAFAQQRLRSQHFKRRPPLIAKISQRTVGTDFRYPRDWGT